jgi:hypothetical protein
MGMWHDINDHSVIPCEAIEMETGTHRSMQHSQATWRSSPAAPAEPVGGWT